MVNKIGKITLYVENQEQAIEFWTKKVGFVVTFEQPMGPNMKWVEVSATENSETSFVLYDKNAMKAMNPNTNVGHPSILLSTKEIEKAYEELKSNGVEVEDLQIMPYGKMFNFKDMDGNLFLLREDK